MTTILDIAIKAAITAGLEILRIYNDPQSDFSIERKADNSPLTIADKASNKIIEDLLRTTEIPVLSEEGKSIDYNERKNWQKFWLVDPLDGTKEFIKMNGEFTVNIALIEQKKPIAGVIYVPVTHILYIGSHNTGSWKIKTTNPETTLIFVTKHGDKLPKEITKRGYVIAGSRSHMNDETKKYLSHLRNRHNNVEIISSGSSLKICMVAEGLADEYPRFGPTMEWDTAAGHAIVNAVGKKLWLTDLSGELEYNKENLLNPYFIVK